MANRVYSLASVILPGETTMSTARLSGIVLILILIAAVSGFSQGGPCPTATSTAPKAPIPTLSGDLICLISQVYGAGGLVGTDHGGPLFSTAQFSHAAHFQNSSLESFSPLNSEIGTELSQLPISSPAAGFVYTFSPSLGVVSRQDVGFGPILTERVDTIGRHKLYVGFAYQYFNFDKADGINLRKLGAVFQHEDESAVCQTQPQFTGCSTEGHPIFQDDIIVTQNQINLKINQYTAVATFGLTDRLDLSVALPILNIRMSMFSDAVIHSFEGPNDIPPCCLHQFASPNPQPGRETLYPADPTFGFNHASFSSPRSATGVGDLIVRGKYEAWRGEKAGVALGLDARFPTGDAYNFLGAGTWGLRPFVTMSYAARVSPHGTLAYQVNGDSILAGDVNQGTRTAKLPDVFSYAFGADAAIIRRVSLTGDFIGQTFYDVTKLVATTFTDHDGDTHPSISSTQVVHLNQQSLAVGGKVNPIGGLLVTLNVLFRLNDAGLHSKPVPLVGLSYTF